MEALDAARLLLDVVAYSRDAHAIAVQAAWRLGEWNALDQLSQSTQQLEGLGVEEILGAAMATLHAAPLEVSKIAQLGRKCILRPLQATIDSPERAHTHFVTLHVLADIEAAAEKLAGDSSPEDIQALLNAWEERRDLVPPSHASREALMLVHAHASSLIARKYPAFVVHASRCWVEMAREARLAVLPPRAIFALHRSTSDGIISERHALEEAKLLWSQGDAGLAMHVLQDHLNVDELSLPRSSSDSAQSSTTEPLSNERVELLLCLLKWTEQSAREDAARVDQLYALATRSRSAKAFYRYGRYLDAIVTQMQRERKPGESSDYSRHLPSCVTNYGLACIHGDGYVNQSLPRLLTLVLDYADESRDDDVAKNLMSVLVKLFKKIPTPQWMSCFAQLASRALHRTDSIRRALESQLVRLISEHPYQALWLFVGFSKYRAADRREMYNRVRLECGKGERGKKLLAHFAETERFVGPIGTLANYGQGSEHRTITQVRLRDVSPELRGSYSLLVPYLAFLANALPATLSAAAGARGEVTIADVEPYAHTYHSKQRPKRFVVRGSDGESYPLIAKAGDDLRKDSRVMDLGVMLNNLLTKHPAAHARNLRMHTYACTPLGEDFGLIEVVPNISPLRDVLFSIYREEGRDLLAMRRTAADLYKKMESENRELYRDEFERLKALFPPRLYQWFLRSFSSPARWFRARQQYTHSVAVMSMFGFILGLGDRHGENLLLEENTGEIVHVDFGCLFWTGQLLGVPETVPFRLTHNMVDAFGVTGVAGSYRRSCEVTLGLLRRHKAWLQAALEAYVHDPLFDWTKPRANASNMDIERAKIQAREHYLGIEERLSGKMRVQVKTRRSSALLPLSVQGQVDALVRDATDQDNLRKLYRGWAPYM